MSTLSERAKLVFQGAVAVAAAFALSCVGLAALQARATAVTVANDADLLTSHAVELGEQIEETVGESRHVLVNSRLALDNVNKAAIAERLYAEHELPDTVERVNDLLDQTRTTMLQMEGAGQAASGALIDLSAGVRGAERVEVQAAELLAASKRVVDHTDAVVSDPHIPLTLQHLNDATAAGASTMQHADATAADTQQAWHSVLHPSWPQRLGRALRRLF